MKKKVLPVVLVCTIGFCISSIAQKTLTANDLNLRPAGSFNVFPNQTNTDGTLPGAGGTSEGWISGAPGYTWPGNGSASSYSVELRWNGLTLDASGTADDYIDFTVEATAKNNGSASSVSWSGLGWGTGGAISTNESVTFIIRDIQANVGTATFNGFTSASAQTGFNVDTTGSIHANGVAIVASNQNGTVTLPNDSLTATNTLTYDNSQYTLGVGFYARNFDIGFTWTTNEPPEEPETPLATVTANNFSPRSGGPFGTYDGAISFYEDGPNNGVPPTSATNSPYKVDFEWNGLDLDGVGGTNDTIYFTLVANGNGGA